MNYAKIISVISLIAICLSPLFYANGFCINAHYGTKEYSPMMYFFFGALFMQIPAFIANIFLHKLGEGRWKTFGEIYAVLIIFVFLFLLKFGWNKNLFNFSF